jgi:hypothetical protein
MVQSRSFSRTTRSIADASIMMPGKDRRHRVVAFYSSFEPGPMVVSYFDDALVRLPVPREVVQLSSPVCCSLYMVES